jgi:hypothetical protein
MTAHTLELTARELIVQGWKKAPRSEMECLLSLAPELAELVRQSHDQPCTRLAPAVRQLILEHRSCAAHLLDPLRGVDGDAQVQRIVNMLEQIRQRGVEDGLWSDAPMPELMCG